MQLDPFAWVGCDQAGPVEYKEPKSKDRFTRTRQSELTNLQTSETLLSRDDNGLDQSMQRLGAGIGTGGYLAATCAVRMGCMQH